MGNFMFNEIKNRPLQAKFVGIVYAGLCIFSIVVGLYYIFAQVDINMVELSQEIKDNMAAFFAPFPLVKVFGIITFTVGVLQGISAYGMLISKNKKVYYLAIGFTIFSFLSCASKIYVVVSLFALAKIVMYALMIACIFSSKVRKIYR